MLSHALPQALQWLAFASRLVSQPFEATASQLPYGLVQPTTSHVPVLQEAVAFARLHGVPHAPQSVLVFRLVSQPSAYWPLQSSKPALQLDTWHVEL